VSEQRFPLSWPAGWRRTPPGARQGARWSKRERHYGTEHSWTTRGTLTVADALKRLQTELDRLGATDVLLSTNVQTRLDGLPYSNRGEPADPGAAVYFKLKRQARCLAVDKWTRVADNIAALAAHIGAIRGIDRYGVGTLEQAFAGYAMLTTGKASWWATLGVQHDAEMAQIEAAYRRVAKLAHPDAGGSHAAMAEVNEAIAEARLERGATQ